MRKIIIALLLIVTTTIFAETYTVKQDGTGDFTTIQAAIDYAVNDDEIIVYEGTYNEQVNFLGKNITVASRFYLEPNSPQYIDNTIIQYQTTAPQAVVSLHNGETNARLIGFTIKDGYRGVCLQGSNIAIIQNCIIKENTLGIYIQPLNSQNSPSPIIDSNTIISNDITGIYCTDRTYPDIINNMIEDNVVGVNAFGVIFDGEIRSTYPTISGNQFISNYKAVQLEYAIVQDFFGNILYDNEYIFNIVGTSNNLQINNCTICDNYQLIMGYLINIPVTNSIIRNMHQFIPNNLQVNYSNIEGGYAGTGNIDADPLLEDPDNGDFSLKWSSTEKSPCINSGVQGFSDPDGSRVDMGAIYHPCDTKTYEFEGTDGEHDGWTWLSFDILDIYTTATTNKIEELWDPIKNSIHRGEQEQTWFEYLDPDWLHGDYEVISPEGFKVKMESEADQIDVSGFRCKDITTFDLLSQAPEGNWIGYFIEKKQHVYDAFDGYLDNIYTIKHQDWSISSDSGVGGWPDVPYTLAPGDMVVVWCEQDIPQFSWMDIEETEGYEVPKSQSFSYTEEADYIPIYFDLDPEDMPDEIGVFQDGECKGATVVVDTLADICAYVTDSQGGSLEFEFDYGRGTAQNYQEYSVIDPETGLRELSSINLRNKQLYYRVSFKDSPENQQNNLPVTLTASTHPNPFNPSTTIAYSIPDDDLVNLTIHNIKGQKVKTLVNGNQQAGSYSTVWNGNDDNGRKVSSGIYLYKLSAGKDTLIKKMMLIK